MRMYDRPSPPSFYICHYSLSLLLSLIQNCMNFRRLEALDTMTQKIVVKATDDVYQTTRDKLAVKNEESKKNWYFLYISATLV